MIKVLSEKSVLSDGLKRVGDLPKLETQPVTDAQLYLAILATRGPLTYGAAARALGWGATRARQAEAALLTDGRARMTAEGRTNQPEQRP